MRTTTSNDTERRAAVVPWPARADLRQAAASEGRPCLLVVADGAPLPVPGELEDWVRAGAGELDGAARLLDLEAFARGRTAGARGLASLPDGLDPHDQRVARALLARAGTLVPREDLADAGCDDHELDASVARVRRALVGTSWRIERVAARGFVALAQERSR